ncbi:MAG: hypothetical protein AAF329_20530 [Cyanobacteria bacterium P01_A01_bin.17]
MKLQQMVLISLLGLSTLPTLASAPAHACTPAPDNPNGCDGLNGNPRFDPRIFELRQKIKFPVGPVCLSCPPYSAKLKEQNLLVQPVLRQENVLLNQDQFGQKLQQPQSFGQ